MLKLLLSSTALTCLLVAQPALAQQGDGKHEPQRQERLEKAAPAPERPSRSEPNAATQRSAPSAERPARPEARQERTPSPTTRSTTGQSSQEPTEHRERARPDRPEQRPADQRRNHPAASERNEPSRGPTTHTQQPTAPSTAATPDTRKPDGSKSTAVPPRAPAVQTQTHQAPPAATQPNTTTTVQQRSGNTGNTATQLPPEKQQRITQTIQQVRVAPPVRNLNVALSIGTPIPRYVRLQPIPRDIVLIEPAYRGYTYFVTEEEFVIVEPRSHRVVTVLPRHASMGTARGPGGGSVAMSGGPAPCRIMRRGPDGQMVEVLPSDARATVGSGRGGSPISVVVQTANGETTHPIPLNARAGQIVVATQGNGDCEVTIEPEPAR